MDHAQPLMRRMPVNAAFGVASATHWLPAQVSMGILEKGGNAFDAAVAGALAFHVSDPCMNGLGGEAVVIVSERARPETSLVVCGQGVAPREATPTRCAELGLCTIPDVGAISAVVPGAFDALMLTLARFGTMSVADVLEPAIFYATSGCSLTQETIRRIKRFKDRLAQWPATAAIYLPGGEVPQPGHVLKNPTLGACLSRLRDEARGGATREAQIERARQAFYRGFVAEEIGHFVKPYSKYISEADRPYCGFLNSDDLSRWTATFEQPVSFEYSGHTIKKAGGWSQGPVLLQVLATAKECGLPSDRLSVEYIHALTEIFKLAYADREAYYGDNQSAPLSELLGTDYNRARALLVGEAARSDLIPGVIASRSPPKMPKFAVVQPRVETKGTARGNLGPKDTCHLNVIDRDHNVVSLTQSGGWFYDSPVIPSLGFSLSTRANMFWIQDGLASTLTPGARPRTTLTPTMVYGRDESVWSLGCRGADYSDQYLVEALLSLFERPTDLQAALDHPVFVSRHWPDSVYPRQARPKELLLDPEYGEDVRAALQVRGHAASFARTNELGRVCAAGILGGRMIGGATSRAQDYGVSGR